MTPESIAYLKRYLLNHELEIAKGRQDYAMLRDVFKDVVGRDAKEPEAHTYTYGHYPG